jgi:hypothetical protein
MCPSTPRPQQPYSCAFPGPPGLRHDTPIPIAAKDPEGFAICLELQIHDERSAVPNGREKKRSSDFRVHAHARGDNKQLRNEL